MRRFKLKLSLVCAFALLAGAAGGVRGSTLVYKNWDANSIGLRYTPWAGILVADDMSLAGIHRQLVHYDYTVFAPGGSTPYQVTSELYTDNGGIPGSAIAGTLCTHTVTLPDQVTLDCTVAPGVILPDLMWMVLEFDNDDAGWVVAEAAELGFTGDIFAENDGSGWSLYSFEGDPYAGFAANIWCEPKPPVPNLKWSQPPIERDPNSEIPTYCGWDEKSYNRDEQSPGEPLKMVADDFRCLGSMPIESVHWWGSYFDWEWSWGHGQMPDELPIAWRIGFWSNVPAGFQTEYSYPEILLWQVEVDAGRIEVEEVGMDDFLGWYPYDVCYQYYVKFEPEEVFWQSDYLDRTIDDIFWLSIAAVYPGEPCEPPDNPWGWKTRPWSWMDDAVKFNLPDSLGPGTVLDPLLVEPIEDPNFGESFDVAFELDTDPHYIKWEQPFTGIRRWPHYEDELSIAKIEPTGEPNVIRSVTDDWLCERETPVTATVWWGSYIGYNYQACTGPAMVQPERPDYFLLSIWTDVPADSCVPESYSHPGEKIWEYQAHEYDEVLVGYDKHPEDPNIPGYEPVFRYSVRLPGEDWFLQQDADDIYWFSVAAVYGDINLPMVYVFVDDFELYSTDAGLRAVWYFIGGGQIGIGVPPEPVHSGVRSMEFQYDTDDPWADESYSEAWAETAGSEAGSDWTSFGAEVLTLWFHGDPDNDANATEQMYVGLQDGSGAYAEARYGEHGEDMNDVKNEEWKQWCIELQEFADDGVDLKDVQTIHIGFGNRSDPVPGGRGTVYFDDIALNDVCLRMPEFPWGWTNHEHVFNDDAVAGHMDDSRAWVWDELFDQTGASEDMSFILFTEPDCLSRSAPEYNDWVALGKPDCWCYRRQCRGDIDGIQTGPFHVAIPDLAIFKQCFNQFVMPQGCICADLDHMQTGPFRVAIPDLTIFKTYFNQFVVPQCDQLPIYTGPYNFWTSP